MVKILIFIIIILGAIALGMPLFQLIKAIIGPSRKLIRIARDVNASPVDEAKMRLKKIEEEVEAARINKQADQLIDQLYSETSEDYDRELKVKNERR